MFVEIRSLLRTATLDDPYSTYPTPFARTSDGQTPLREVLHFWLRGRLLVWSGLDTFEGCT